MIPKKRSVTTIWFISYLIILILPIVINLITYVRLEKLLLNNIDEHNVQLLYNATQSLDTMYEHMMDVATKTSARYEVHEMANYRYPFDKNEQYDINHFASIWWNSIESKDINSMFIYLPKSNYIVSSVPNEPQAYYNVYIKSTGATFEEWFDFVKNSKNGFNEFDSGDEHRMFYVHRSNQILLEDQAPVIIVEANPQYLLAGFTGNGKNFFAFDDDGKMLVGEDTELANLILEQRKIHKNGEFTLSYSGTNYVVCSVVSADTGFTYASAVSDRQYLGDVIFSRWILLIAICICLIAGMILIRWSIRRNNEPVRNLIALLSDGTKNEDNLNEYQYINKKVVEAIQQRDTYESKFSIQHRVMREDVLSKLLYGMEEQDEIELMDAFNINFPYEHFAVALIYIDDISELYFNQQKDLDEAFRNAQFIVTNILEEMLRRNYYAKLFRCDNMLACIINIPKCDQTVRNEIVDIFGEANDFILKNFNFEFVSAISKPVTNPHMLSIAYKEVLETMEYKFVFYDQRVLEPDVLNHNQNNSQYYYPIETEQKIINYLKMNEQAKAMDLLDEVLKINFDQYHISLPLSKCLMFEITGTMLKTIGEISASEEDTDFLSKLDVYERLINCQNIEKMRSEMIKLINEISVYIEDCSKKSRDILVVKAKEYVDVNYNDPNLTVSAVSGYLTITPNYLSVIFKQHEGIGLLEYISRLRINKAKDLLMTTNLTLEAIGAAVGYPSIRTFSRVFNKYEGVSPGKYRSLK